MSDLYPDRRVVGRHRILDFDIENRPLHYWYGDATTGEITIIAWSFLDEHPDDDLDQSKIHVAALYPWPEHVTSAVKMLQEFVKAYDEAQLVTGHFIRGHDLPMVNGGLMELGLPTLHRKLTSDTKLDLTKRKYMSVSQKNLADMLGVEYPKVDMPQGNWRESNRLTPPGIELAKARAVGDVLQHMAMRRELLRRHLLATPKVWLPNGHAPEGEYIP